jgi:hypothetical protein
MNIKVCTLALLNLHTAPKAPLKTESACENNFTCDYQLSQKPNTQLIKVGKMLNPDLLIHSYINSFGRKLLCSMFVPYSFAAEIQRVKY